MKVTILDYGAGNVPSVERALQRHQLRSRQMKIAANPDAT